MKKLVFLLVFVLFLLAGCSNPDPRCKQQKTDDCRIKGNISSSGEKIYHLPSGQYYKETMINPAIGECWFCSRKDAQDMGWRKAIR